MDTGLQAKTDKCLGVGKGVYANGRFKKQMLKETVEILETSAPSRATTMETIRVRDPNGLHKSLAAMIVQD